MTNYDESFEGVHVLYDKPNLVNTLGEAVSAQGRTQLRMAETEKYPHVTFFLSGGREEPFEGEQRAMAASPKVATYDLQPEMSAPELTEKAVEALTSWQPDFLCLNFANPDMVGHTGVFEAVVKAVETTDQCLKQVMETAKAEGYAVVVIADHGNADLARNTDGTPHTAHTTNPVPIWVHGPEGTKVRDGILADVAPTVLQLMGLNQPTEMTGKSLVACESTLANEGQLTAVGNAVGSDQHPLVGAFGCRIAIVVAAVPHQFKFGVAFGFVLEHLGAVAVVNHQT